MEKDSRKVREWLISLLDQTAKPFTPEVDAAMQELWKKRDRVFGEHKMIVLAFEAVLDYRQKGGSFTPYYFDQQDRLGDLRQEIVRRVQALKDYVEKAS